MKVIDNRVVEIDRRYEVRCCCQPQKVLGTYPWPSISGEISLWVLDENGDARQETIRLRTISHYGSDPGGEPTRLIEYAIYSEDRGIEFWRNLDGFEEARDVEGSNSEGDLPIRQV